MAQQIDQKRFICTVCGYVYDPENGDIRREIPAGSPFSSLPSDWTCPVCGAGKTLFREM